MNLINSLNLFFTVFFLLVVLSYYILILTKEKKIRKEKNYKSITVIIPAHNEEWYIEESIESVLAAKFKGTKEIIVVDDGSKDNTYKLAKKFLPQIKIIKKKQTGKSDSLNTAIKQAKGELIAIVDGDSIIGVNALQEVANKVMAKNVAAASCPVRVKNRKGLYGMWLHISEIYYSMQRGLFTKINGNITTPGPLSVYRKDVLEKIGLFSTDGFSEDADITIRIIRSGYRTGFSEKAIAETYMPHKFKELFRQRTRFSRGLVKLFKKHLRLNKAVIDVYTFPIFLFGYFQSVIMGSLTIYNIVSGYTKYFASQGVYMSKGVLFFILDWFSLLGFIKWTIRIIGGQDPLTIIASIGIISTFLTYPLYFLAIFKYDKKFDIWHLIPLFFMAPFWMAIMVTQIISIPELFKKKQYNIWKKNE